MANKPVKIAIIGDASKFNKAMGNVDRGLKGMLKPVAALGAALAGAFVVDKLVGFGVELFNLGSELQLLDTKISTVFGAQENQVREWADGLNESLGISETQVAGLAAGMADLLKPMGFTSDQAAQMSMETVELSGALSMWTGGQYDAAAVSEILSKAMLGERDGLKALGISINQAEVDQRALEIARLDGRDAITAQDQAMATQQLIMEKSTDAQDAYAESQKGLTGQLNTLKAKWADIKETLARALIPIFTKVATLIVDKVVPAVESLWTKSQPYIELLISKFRAFWTFLGPIFTSVIGWFQGFRDSFSNTSEETSGKITALQRIFAGFKEFLGSVFAFIAALIDAAKRFWNAWGDEIMAVVSRIIDYMLTAFQGALQILTGIFEFFTALIQGDWDGMWEAVKKILDGALTILTAALSLFWDFVSTIFTKVKNWITSKWSEAWEGIKTKLSESLSSIKTWMGNLPGELRAKLSTALTALKQKGLDLITGLWDGIKEKFIAVKGWFLTLPTKIRTAAGNMGTVLKSAGKAVLTGFWDGLKEKWNEVKGWLGGIADQIPNLKGPIDKDRKVLIDNGKAVMDGFQKGLGKGWGDVKTQLRGYTADLSGSMPVDAAGAGLGGNTTINVTANTNADPFQIGREVAWTMKTGGR